MSFFKALLASTLGFFLAMFLFVILLFGMIIFTAANITVKEHAVVASNSVLVVEPAAINEFPDGPDMSGLGFAGGDPTLLDYLRRIDAAAIDADIRGMWLKLGRFTGSWAQAEELRAKVLDFRRSGKFVYATSGLAGYDEKNYFIATAADTVVLERGGRMEINGIFAEINFYKPLMEKLGVKAEVIRAGAYKSAVEPYVLDSASAESREMMTALIDGTFGRFTEVVTGARKLSPTKVQEIVEAYPMLNPSEAYSLGLVDAVLYADEVTAMLKRRLGDTAGRLRSVDLDEYVDGSDDAGSQVAIVYAVGTITRGPANSSPIFGGEMLTSERFVEAMRTARESGRVKAVVLRINSPGGDADASEAMWREVSLTAAQKPVVVSMGGVAASGGYYIAAPAHVIMADPTTVTGSIGAFGMRFNMEEFFEKTIGINTQVFKTGPSADLFNPARPLTDLERSFLERTIDSTYRRFLAVVAEGRHMTTGRADSVGQGRVWTGMEAQKRGLVDMLGGLDSAIQVAATRAKLERGDYGVRVLPKRKEFVEMLAEAFGKNASLLAGGGRRTVLDDYRGAMEALMWRAGIQYRMPDVVLK